MKNYRPNYTNKLYSECELSNLRVLYYIYAFLIISLIVMPQYFGVHLGYDLTCSRLADIFIIFYFFSNGTILSHFVKTISSCKALYALFLYLFVAFYTAGYRADVNAFFSVFFEILNFALLIYGIRYIVGYRRTIKWITICAYVLSVLGIVEYIYGKSFYLQIFATLPTAVRNIYRSGRYRIMGPCGHPLGYGLLLLLLLAFACYDEEKDRIYLVKRPCLVILLLLNVFLTGSRSSLGIFLAEFIVLFFFQKRNEKKITASVLVIAIGFASVFLFLLQNSGIGRVILGQLASIVDTVLGTQYAVKFGIDSQSLANSDGYRKALLGIFKLDWLNPIVGRGLGFGGVAIDGVFIHSIDNHYINQYIRYAYPGLISYVLFLVIASIEIVREWVHSKNSVVKVILISLVAYYVNLWWVDSLQTLKFAYLFFAVFYAFSLHEREKFVDENES